MEPHLRPILETLAQKASARFESEDMMVRTDGDDRFYRVLQSDEVSES